MGGEGFAGGRRRVPPIPLTLLPFLAASLVLAWLLLLPLSPSFQINCGGRGAVIFNFGDSNSDTGGLVAAVGYRLYLPNGRLFFHRSTGRASDGRLIIDFLCESLNTSYLSPYLESLGSDFRNGANFAIGGSGTLPKDVPFSLNVQLFQFLRFKSRSLELVAQGSRALINEDGFRNVLYTIDTGQNDLAGSFASNLSYEQVIASIPAFLSQIKNTIKTIYYHGGRNFWIHNTGPLGCLPQELSQRKQDNRDLDPYGCLVPLNNAAKAFNFGLSALCDEMSSQFSNATIVYTDIYSIKFDLVANYTKYGFESPVMACCGTGGPPYNVNGSITCGEVGYNVCEEGTRYISWDGVHYTEAANAIIASKILSTEYSKPPFKFDFFCSA